MPKTRMNSSRLAETIAEALKGVADEVGIVRANTRQGRRLPDDPVVVFCTCDGKQFAVEVELLDNDD